VPTPSTAATARQLHLTRTARMAGEAFAFVDQEDRAFGRRAPAARITVALAWLTLGLMAATVLFQLI
jgi:hypothetical protein